MMQPVTSVIIERLPLAVCDQTHILIAREQIIRKVAKEFIEAHKISSIFSVSLSMLITSVFIGYKPDKTMFIELSIMLNYLEDQNVEI